MLVEVVVEQTEVRLMRELVDLVVEALEIIVEVVLLEQQTLAAVEAELEQVLDLVVRVDQE
tara:strand:- start:307 stop:489 length:183 start_codon:yes stop_codon:yes gene_type:complete